MTDSANNSHFENDDADDSLVDGDGIEGVASDESATPGSEEARAPYRQCKPGYTRMRMTVSYDGTEFLGWQRQTKHVSVQGTLEAALSKIANQPITVLGASRTDTGVHASGQVAHFDWPRNPEGWDFQYAIQCLTPRTIVVKELFIAPPDFHSIALVTDKVYTYRILNRKVPSALRNRYTHWVRFPLDLDYLNKASSFLVGKHDFKAFQSTGTKVLTTIREIKEAYWTRFDEDTLEFTIRGNGFLKQMVRNIVGTVVELNQDGLKPERVTEIMATLDRRRAGPTAPPQGLFLKRVNYPEAVDIKCRKL